MLQIGSLLDHKYRILSEIGRGGMSVVYLAINERANKTWAVKVIRKDSAQDPSSVHRHLAAETSLLKRLRHPNLPSIIDVLDDKDSLIIVMDYIEGTSLLERIKENGPQPEDEVIRWGIQLCDVLGYLHRQDPPVIYRDMKPANVILKPDGNVSLIDFGTAREYKYDAKDEDTTCLGTRGYAAPEQFGGKGQTDARTDIYCLGATLYHLLTGHSPAEPPYEIKPLSFWMPHYRDSGLEKMLLKCTKPDPSERYRDCKELMYELHHYKDNDLAGIRRRKKQWMFFVTCLLTGCIGLGGSIAFLHLRNDARKASCAYLVEKARAQSSLREAGSYIRQALEVNAADADVYNALLVMAADEITANGDILSAETAGLISECLTSTSGGFGTNISVLEKERPDVFTKVMYRIGIWRFFMMENTDENRKNAAVNYFSRITGETYLQYLSAPQQELAKTLEKLGTYIGELRSSIGKYDDAVNAENSYITLFEDLSIIASGDLKEMAGQDIYCIRIYEQIADRISKEAGNLIDAGISHERLETLVRTILRGLEELHITESGINYPEYRSAVGTAEAALRGVSRAGREEGG